MSTYLASGDRSRKDAGSPPLTSGRPWIIGRRERLRIHRVALRKQIKAVHPANEAAPAHEEMPRAVRRNRGMNLPADDGGVRAELAARQRAVVVGELAEDAFKRTVLAHARPDREIVGVQRRDLRPGLIAILHRVQAADGCARACV